MIFPCNVCQNRSMLRIGAVVLGVGDIRRASEFWREALRYVPRDGALGPDDDWIVLVPADSQGTALALGTSESPVQERPRVHLDLYVDSAAEQAVEVGRLVPSARSGSTGISTPSRRTSSCSRTPKVTASAWSTRATSSGAGARISNGDT